MPLGLLSIAAYLKTFGYETQLLDSNVMIRKLGCKMDETLMKLIYDSILEFKPAMLGVSVMGVGQIEMALATIEMAKQIDTNTVTVLGGAHASQFAVKILEKCSALDYVVLGEGELQSAWIVQNSVSHKLSEVIPEGIAYRNGSDIKLNPKRTFIKSLDSLPTPAYSLVHIDDYSNDTSGWHNPLGLDLKARVPIMTSRGCSLRCNFCSISTHMGEIFRPMSATAVVNMLQILYEHHGVKVVAIHDANFTHNTKRVLEICNEISKRRLGLSLDIYTGVPINATSPETIHALADVGLVRLGLSIESGDLHIRNDIMGKQFEDEQIYALVDACRQHPEVYLGADFVLGMPEDTEESLERTFSLIKKLDLDEVDMTLAIPFPGTRLYAQCIRDGLFSEDINIDELWRTKYYSWNYKRNFFIKPYNLNYEQLYFYYDLFQKLRADKFTNYRERMKRVYGIDSSYGLRFDSDWSPYGRRM